MATKRSTRARRSDNCIGWTSCAAAIFAKRCWGSNLPISATVISARPAGRFASPRWVQDKQACEQESGGRRCAASGNDRQTRSAIRLRKILQHARIRDLLARGGIGGQVEGNDDVGEHRRTRGVVGARRVVRSEERRVGK